MLQGHQSWVFPNKPTILGTAAVVGPFEGKGPLAADFDIIHGDIWMEQDSFEKAERLLLEEACEKAIEKSGVEKGSINFYLAGDLINQITPSSFSARTIGTPYLGLFGACSTSMEGLALASQLVDSQAAEYALAGTCSHNATAEKQFRYPTEYGSQKPPTSQWTVTGAGAAVIGKKGTGPRVIRATIGRVIDMGMSDPFNMGGAMAPAAVDTIQAHFRDFGIDASEYDAIITGDLGRVGHAIASDLLRKHNMPIPEEKFFDCGILIYGDDPTVFAGGSGCGCCASVTYGHFMNRMKKGEIKKMLVIGTGSLLSPLSYQQKESIPCVAHAVAIEMDKGGMNQ
jgi:stage V sporulation protein AD